jgi:acetolactate synthase-1/2/3 large subunit
VVAEIGKHLAPDATRDVGCRQLLLLHPSLHPIQAGQIFLASVVGAMGSGVPMAVAAGAAAAGDGRRSAFVGDGGALMTGNEIATAMQYGVNPIVVISDNQLRHDRDAPSHALSGPAVPCGDDAGEPRI